MTPSNCSEILCCCSREFLASWVLFPSCNVSCADGIFLAILRLFPKNSLKRLLGPGCHKQGKQCWIGNPAHNTERNGTDLQPGAPFPGTGEGPQLLDQRTLWGEGKTASICLFWGASSEFTVFGGPRITRGWERKTARKVSLSHPFLRPHMLVKTLICEECPIC